MNATSILLEVIYPLTIILIYLATPIIIITIVKTKNRKKREKILNSNYCEIGCRNCNAQQCPNNPNYISKLI